MSRHRLLVLSPFAPRRDATHGGSRAIAELVVRLGERHDVALLALRSHGEPPAGRDVIERCAEVRIVEYAPPAGAAASAAAALGLLAGAPMWVRHAAVPEFAAMTRSLAATWRPDIVQLEYHLMGQYLPALDATRVPRVLHQIEPGTLAAHDRLAQRHGWRRLLGRVDCLAWRRYERWVMARVDAIVALTAADEAALRSLAGATPIVRIPLVVPLPSRAAEGAESEPLSMLFVGNFVHPPNVAAAHRLVTRILPRVRARRPDVRLQLVGPNPPPGLSAPGLEVAGEVPDVAPWLEQAAVVVAPLETGGGMRVKVAEALAAGKALVATPLAVHGLALTDGREARIASDDEALAAAILELLDDRAARLALGARARAWAEAHLSGDESMAAFDALYDRLRGSRAA